MAENKNKATVGIVEDLDTTDVKEVELDEEKRII